MAQFDVVVVGGGHNGLTAACYLAKAGVRVVVLERRRLVGGAAVTEESFPGYQISRASYEPHIEDPIVEELELRKYGYITGQGDPRVFHPFKNGNYLFLHRDPEKTAKEIERFSRDDARAYIKFHKMAKKFGDMFSPLILSPPPSITELVSLIEGSEFDEVIRYFLLMGSEQLVNEFFESEEVKVTFCQISVGNTAMSPSEVGSAYLLAFSESSGASPTR